MSVRAALEGERPGAAAVFEALDAAVKRFLPGYSNLRPHSNAPNVLTIDHRGDRIDVAQLSDGERGALALVLDLTRRMAQLNPLSKDPASESDALVLIDEIDLHLHPQWQRSIVRNLSNAFPRCQFIVTTHSPQVIGEVEAERIRVIQEGGVYVPERAFGVDSSSVLEEIMETSSRTKAVAELLTNISEAIAADDMVKAKTLMANLAARVGEGDPEVIRLETLLDFLKG
jgi:predicted ATP-binding protein involved in virulence